MPHGHTHLFVASHNIGNNQKTFNSLFGNRFHYGYLLGVSLGYFNKIIKHHFVYRKDHIVCLFFFFTTPTYLLKFFDKNFLFYVCIMQFNCFVDAIVSHANLNKMLSLCYFKLQKENKKNS